MITPENAKKAIEYLEKQISGVQVIQDICETEETVESLGLTIALKSAIEINLTALKLLIGEDVD
jgi:hypothetical protein